MASAAAGPALGPAHRRRLREVFRSAGWPCQDMIELDLLAAGLLVYQRDAAQRDTLRLTDAGLQALAATRAGHRAARDAHEALVDRVARDMHRGGRIVWCGLALRAPLAPQSSPPAEPAPATGEPSPRRDPVPAALWPSDAGPHADPGTPRPPAPVRPRWAMAMPDVFSIRHTTREDRVHPVVHEIKVQRSDLLADLKRPDKGEAYRALSSECWYVLRAGIGGPADVPEVYGVMLAHPTAGDGADGFGALEVLRPAPRRPFTLPFALWMALARAVPRHFEDETEAQGLLGQEGCEGCPPDTG